MAKDKPGGRPTSLDVILSDGSSVTVGPLNWAGYKRLKTRVVEKLADRASVVFADEELMTKGNAVIVPLMAALDDVLADSTPEFVASCVENQDSLKSVDHPVDWLRLRQAGAEVNNLEELLELEGNAIAASVKTVMSRLMDAANMAGVGGSTLNPSLPLPTAGASVK